MAEKKVAALVFSTTDFFGNIVRLGTKTWREHVIVGPEGHPEMAGYENLVKEVLEEPSMVRLAGFDTSLAFISEPGVGPSPEGIRVLVDYADTCYEKGSSAGKVATAYPIDIVRYPSPKLGRVIYERKVAR